MRRRADCRRLTPRSKTSPIDQLNVIFSHAGLPIEFSLTNRGLTAKKHQTEYSVEALSDGERASLFVASAILTQESGHVLLIDEPEKHLHPSITGLLIETSLRTRTDIPVVISSHDMSLIEQLAVQSTIYVRDSRVVSAHPHPEQRVYDVELLTGAELPEQLRRDVLGARSKILYVEGTDLSRDAALYAPVYKRWKVISKGGSQTVIESTRGIRTASGLHWLSAGGLVDGDGRSHEEIEKLRSQGVLTLPTPTIENLFFLEEAQKCFVDADLQMRGGKSWADRQADLETIVQPAVAAHLNNIISRRALWRAQREIASQSLSVKDVSEDRVATISVDVAAIKNAVATEIIASVSASTAPQLLKQLPIKNTDIPDAAARALGAASFKIYCEVIQRQIDIESENGKSLIAALVDFLPKLEQSLPAAPVVPSQPGPRTIGLPAGPANPLTPPVLQPN